MHRERPWLYATLTKGKEVRHLLILFLNGSAATELVQLSDGFDSSIATGTEYEMKEKADSIVQLWVTQDNFARPREGFAFESLARTIALAMKMGYTTVYDRSYAKMDRPPFNLTGAVSLSTWPGMSPKNGGGYEYALDQMRLHARPTLPPSPEPLIAPSGGKEFAAFVLKHKAILDTVGPFAEFILTGD
jgi:hypothetical protein